MTRDQFIEWAESRGWKLDRYGHLKKSTGGKTYRFKLSRIAVRYEYQLKIDGSYRSTMWIRIKSGYFSKLSITDEGKLTGMKR